MLRHSASHCLFHHASEVPSPRQRQLGQGQEGAELPEGYYTHAPHSVRRFTDALRRWVDTAYAIHDDCRGHTGVRMSFGQGMALSYSWKQTINIKSLTKAELVGVDNALGYPLGSLLYARAGIRYGSISALSGQHECYPAQD